MQAPSNQGQSYQGYPYVKPITIDAPSIDAETAAKWTNLPRKQINSVRKPSFDNPVIYVDIPESAVVNGSNNNSETSIPNQNGTANIWIVEEQPRVHIISPPIRRGNNTEASRREERAVNSREDEREGSNTTFVEETIFYDPFEDRRINVGPNQEQPTSTRLTTAGASGSSGDTYLRQPQPGNSGGISGSSSNPTSSRAPPFTSKETYVYDSTSSMEDRFPPSPIPVSQFPIPPPAYTEIDTPPPRPAEPPPRTEVIVPPRPVTLLNSDRKLVSCPNCGLRVHTLMIREFGPISHIIACLFFFILVPTVLIVYCTNCFKYKNHYCPNCNQRVGYEIPILCTDMVYSKPN